MNILCQLESMHVNMAMYSHTAHARHPVLARLKAKVVLKGSAEDIAEDIAVGSPGCATAPSAVTGVAPEAAAIAEAAPGRVAPAVSVAGVSPEADSGKAPPAADTHLTNPPTLTNPAVGLALSSRKLERQPSAVSVASSSDAPRASQVPPVAPPQNLDFATKLAQQLAATPLSVLAQRAVKKTKKKKTKKTPAPGPAKVKVAGKVSRKRTPKEPKGLLLPEVRAKRKARKAVEGRPVRPVKKAALKGGEVVAQEIPKVTPTEVLAPEVVKGTHEAAAQEAGKDDAHGPKGSDDKGMEVQPPAGCIQDYVQVLQELPEDARPPQCCKGKHSYTLAVGGRGARITVLSGTQYVTDM